MLNRKILFDELRKRLFVGGFKQSQVDGINFLLDVWERDFRKRTPVTQFAVVLATAYHETAATMLPIREKGSNEYLRLNYDVTGRNPDRAKRMGNVRPGDGVKYCGRGFVQCTWFVNYQKATKRLRELGLSGPDVDFTLTPDKAMEPRFAAPIMFIGMEEGWFTGRTLDQLVDPLIDGDEHADAVKSRAIINGTDRAEKIAGHADHFLAALLAADVDPEPQDKAVKPPVPKPPAAPVPMPPDIPKPIEPLPEPGFWSKFAALFKPRA